MQKFSKSQTVTVSIIVALMFLMIFFVSQKYLPSDRTVTYQVKNILGEKNNIFKDLNKKQEIKLLFIGDIMMDRSIRKRAESVGYDFYFQCASSAFAEYDFVVANLESTVTNYESVSLGKPQEDYNHFRFTINPIALTAMKTAGINVLGVDNNHIFDFGKEGIEMTRENVLQAGVNYFGDPINENYSRIKLEKSGISFTIVPYNEFFGSAEKTFKNIEEIKTESDPIIIFSHWGDEYVPAPDRVKILAHKFIDAGADVIIGVHPHVVQETETYNNKFIAYSIGNFIFDQYWMSEVKAGGAVELILDKNGIKTSRFLKVYLNEQRQPCISNL